jgi:tRNA (guanine37-N1)-methyltransferase
MNSRPVYVFPGRTKRKEIMKWYRLRTQQIRWAEAVGVPPSLLGSLKGFETTPTNNTSPHNNKSTIVIASESSTAEDQVHYSMPTIRIPDSKVHSFLSNPGFRSYLPIERFRDVHPRVKMVHDDEEDKVQKLVLLDPDKIFHSKNGSTPRPDEVQDTMSSLLPELRNMLAPYQATPGPILTISIKYTQLPTVQMLSLLLPSQALPPPTSYEVIGHLMHLNLKTIHLPYKHIIGAALLQKFEPTISTVVNKVGEVGGQYRTYEMELLAGEPCFNVTVVEGGISLQFDARHVYWSSRLAGERARMMQEEILPRQVIADAFCGVGALCIAAAKKKGCTIWANDLNPYAVECCRINAIRNGLKRVTDSGAGAGKGHTTTSTFTVVCEDAKDFIRSLGYRREWENGRDHNSEEVTQNIKVHSTTLLSKKQRSASSQPMDLPHHLIMNYPLDAPAFLDQLRWWPSTSQVETTVHIYTFARADPSTGRDAETVAIDCIAQSLLPQGGAVEMTHNRQSELDALGCNVRAREIRDVAPQKMVIYVAFQATRLLIKRMQGNFGG